MMKKSHSDLRVKKNARGAGVRLREIVELRTRAAVLAKEVYFEGGDVLRCNAGRFRFSLEGREPVEIGAGEAIVTYPDQRVTIEALDRRNALMYAVFEGHGVSSYFDGFGFFDGLHGRVSEQRTAFELARKLLDGGANMDVAEVRRRIFDAFATYGHDFRDNVPALVFDAVRQIHKNLSRRIVQLKPLCEQLKVTRAYLHRVFVRAGYGSPSEFIRHEQLRVACRLLKDDRLSIAEVAGRAGFLSQTHFADFIKRYTGHTARELRG